MAQKTTCPACESHTSAVHQAFLNGDNCPYCGLPAEAAIAVIKARQVSVSEELVSKFIESEKANERLKKALDRARTALSTISEAAIWYDSDGKEGRVV